MFLLKVPFPYFRALCKKTVKHFFTKKKERAAGAEGRKLEMEEAKKSSKSSWHSLKNLEQVVGSSYKGSHAVLEICLNPKVDQV